MKYTENNSRAALLNAGASKIDAASIVQAASAKGYAAKELWEQTNERETFTPSFNERAERVRGQAFSEHIAASLENYR